MIKGIENNLNCKEKETFQILRPQVLKSRMFLTGRFASVHHRNKSPEKWLLDVSTFRCFFATFKKREFMDCET